MPFEQNIMLNWCVLSPLSMALFQCSPETVNERLLETRKLEPEIHLRVSNTKPVSSQQILKQPLMASSLVQDGKDTLVVNFQCFE